MPVIAIGSHMTIFMIDLTLNVRLSTTMTIVATTTTTIAREIAATSTTIVEETITSIVVIVDRVSAVSSTVLSLSKIGLQLWSSVGTHLLRGIEAKIRFKNFSEIDGSN